MSDRWEYEIRHNSSVDQIERAMRFYRAAADFLELIDLSEDPCAREMLIGLQARAMAIVANESGR